MKTAVILAFSGVLAAGCSQSHQDTSFIAAKGRKFQARIDTCYNYSADTLSRQLFFPVNNPWNTRVDSAGGRAIPVDPRSATILRNHAGGDSGLVASVYFECAVPYNIINHGALTDSLHGELAANHPDGSFDYLPENHLRFPTLAGTRVEITDPHRILVDTATKFLYELYQSRLDPATGVWYHQGAARFNLSRNERRGDTLLTSADAAGLPILPGLLRIDELERGEIRHALRMTLASALTGYLAPATHAPKSKPYPPDGQEQNIEWAPMGARLRLKSSFPDTGFTKQQLVIIKCLKQYGVFVADLGTNFGISATDDCRFSPMPGWRPGVFVGDHKYSPSLRLINKWSRELRRSDFEVVKFGHVTPRCDSTWPPVCMPRTTTARSRHTRAMKRSSHQ